MMIREIAVLLSSQLVPPASTAAGRASWPGWCRRGDAHLCGAFVVASMARSRQFRSWAAGPGQSGVPPRRSQEQPDRKQYPGDGQQPAAPRGAVGGVVADLGEIRSVPVTPLAVTS